MRPYALIPALAFFLLNCATPPSATGPTPARPAVPIADIQPVVRTVPVTDDPDDPAVWVNPADPEKSLILGTNKVKAPNGALAVFALDGSLRQTVKDLDRPNNVDVEYGLATKAGPIDIAVVTERLQSRLRVFEVNRNGVKDITGDTRVFAGRSGEQAAPMGVSLYRRAGDGVIFAIVAPKEGPTDDYLAQYRLESAGGKVNAVFVRYFGVFSGKGEIEAVAVDDAKGFVYYADEGDGIHKYHANPDHPAASAQLAHFGRTGFRADREGIGIYTREDGSGFLVCTDQLKGNSEYHIFQREGELNNPHNHAKELRIVRGGADETDGLEVVSRPLGPRFPKGLMVVMNSSGKNFLVYSWADVMP